MLTGQKKKGRYVYYTHDCANEGKFLNIKEADILGAIENEIESARYSPDFAENLKLLFRSVGENQHRDHRSEIDRLAAKEKALMKRKSRLYDLYSDNEWDRDLLKAKVDDANQELKKLENYRQSFTTGYDKTILQICDIIDELRDRPAAALATSGHSQSEILRELSEGVELYRSEGSKGWTARMRWKRPYRFLMEAKSTRKAAMEADFETPVTARPRMLPFQDDAVTKEAEEIIINWKIWKATG